MGVGRFDLAKNCINSKLYRNKHLDKKYIKNEALIKYNNILIKNLLNGSAFTQENMGIMEEVNMKVQNRTAERRFEGKKY